MTDISAIRGATTAENTVESILENTKELLKEVLSANNLQIEDLFSVIFTCTKDLDAAYPAAAAREMGITKASLMCAQEMHVKGSLEKCIRLQVLAKNPFCREPVHVYLKKAKALRPDLFYKSEDLYGD